MREHTALARESDTTLETALGPTVTPRRTSIILVV